jgi:hypothetical protein
MKPESSSSMIIRLAEDIKLFAFDDQAYFMENGKVVIEYSLWEERPGAKIGNPVDLAVQPVPGGDGKPSGRYRELTQQDELPLVSVNLRKTVLDRYSVSLHKSIMPLLSEINDRLTQVSKQFRKHMNAKLQISWSRCNGASV